MYRQTGAKNEIGKDCHLNSPDFFTLCVSSLAGLFRNFLFKNRKAHGYFSFLFEIMENVNHLISGNFSLI